MYHFCTYFDQNYLTRGLALYRSLTRHCDAFTLYVLCLDDTTRQVLSALQLPEVRLLPLDDLEQNDQALLQIKGTRSLVEYYWTLTPALSYHLINSQPEIDLLTYLDADLYFYASPAPIYEELRGGSILVVEHRYAPDRAYAAETRGIYNVSLLAFRRDANGLECLAWWRERCLEWCYRRIEQGRFGDQKYLDHWPSRFAGVVVLQHQGAGLAPWNVARYSFTRHNGQLMVDNDPLIFFHFHGFRIRTSWLFEPVGVGYDPVTPLVRTHVCAPYIRELRWAMKEAHRMMPGITSNNYPGMSWRTLLRKLLQGRLMLAFGPLVV